MRDLRRIHLAQRLIRLEVRTTTICAWTGLNEERVRNLARFCDAGSSRALLADLENDPYERQFPFVGPQPPSIRSMGRALAYVACVSFVLVACSREPSGAVQTVSYFQDHHDERQAMVARCANDSVRLAMTPNCINAVEAQANEDPGSFRKVPSMGLTQEPDVDLDDPGRPQVRPY